MPWDDSQLQRVRQALQQVGALKCECPTCDLTDWTLAEGVAVVQVKVSGDPQGVVHQLPSVALVCDYCGYTRLHNMMVLGLHDLVEEVK